MLDKTNLVDDDLTMVHIGGARRRLATNPVTHCGADIGFLRSARSPFLDQNLDQSGGPGFRDRAPGTKFRISLEVNAISEAGFPEDVENIVKDNTTTLGFTDKRFD